ncbi:MAG: hypothetical protein ACRDZW_07045, partial [Acidimicrobiales bacterium]
MRRSPLAWGPPPERRRLPVVVGRPGTAGLAAVVWLAVLPATLALVAAARWVAPALGRRLVRRSGQR